VDTNYRVAILSADAAPIRRCQDNQRLAMAFTRCRSIGDGDSDSTAEWKLSHNPDRINDRAMIGNLGLYSFGMVIADGLGNLAQISQRTRHGLWVIMVILCTMVLPGTRCLSITARYSGF